MSPTRDAEAAQRFFCKALQASPGSAPHHHSLEALMAQTLTPTNLTSNTSAPRVINVDKNAAYPKAMAALKANGVLPENVELTSA